MVANSNTALGRLLDALRSHRVYVPSTLTFPQLDVPANSERLRLFERGEENGRENRPASSASQPDRVESEIAELVQQEYAHAVDIYRQGLARIIHEALEAAVLQRDRGAVFRGVGDAVVGV